MRNPRSYLKPLAIGAPEPVTDIPVKPSRSIHFFDPSNPKMAAKLPELATKADILLGNLEDAIAADKKVEARQGLVKVGREVKLGDETSAGAKAGTLTVTGALGATTVDPELTDELPGPDAWWRLTHPVELFGLN